MGVFDVFGVALAAVVVVMCFDRMRKINWRTHKIRFVATPLLFFLWGLFFGVDAFQGVAAPHQFLGALGIVGWLASTFKTWVAGAPEYTERHKT